MRSTLLLSGIRGGPSFPMLQRNPQALDHHLRHESQLTGRGQHMPEEGHSDTAGIQSLASICTRSVIRPLLKYTAWPACPPEVSSRHCEIHKLREFMEHLMMICGFYCLQKKFGILVAQHFRSDPEVTHCMSGWHGGVEGHSDIAGIHSPGSLLARSVTQTLLEFKSKF